MTTAATASETPRRPVCSLTNRDGNAFAIIARVRRCLREDGQPERAAAWVEAATSCPSYDALLGLTWEYVDPREGVG